MQQTNFGEILGSASNHSLNTYTNLFYLNNSRGLTAIDGKAYNATNNIKGVDDDLIYNQYLSWLEEL